MSVCFICIIEGYRVRNPYFKKLNNLVIQWLILMGKYPKVVDLVSRISQKYNLRRQQEKPRVNLTNTKHKCVVAYSLAKSVSPTKILAISPTFHQHFTRAFFVKKRVLCNFSLITVWLCIFLAKEYQCKSYL